MYLVVGLGNPGERYENTRHNVGFKAIDLCCQKLGIGLTGLKFQSRNIRATIQGKKAMLLCPLTFMNQSGAAVKACVDYYKISSRDILVIHDDLDLPMGRLKVVEKSGSGGHKGVQSIMEFLGTNQFARLKIGIGRPRYNETVEDYVLCAFYSDEKKIAETILQEAVAACEFFLANGIESTMTKFNPKNFIND